MAGKSTADRRRSILAPVVAYLWEQEPADRIAWELKSITLRLVGMALHGDAPNLDHAAMLAVGRSFERWRQAVRARSVLQEMELAAAIPDYDPLEHQHARQGLGETGMHAAFHF